MTATEHTNLPEVVDRETWKSARVELLEAEKAMTRSRDALSTRRRELPMVLVDKEYRFTGPGGDATLADMFEGRSPGARSSLNKVWWSELDVRLHEAALGLLGPLAELEADAPGAVDHGAWMKGYQFALSGPIYAGTNEIQRNVIAERVLGLPRK